MNRVARTRTQQDYQQRILRVLLHIQVNLDQPIDLDLLAAIAHLSPFHFHRIFRGMVGEPVISHVRRLRLERAAGQLKSGSKPVTRIALDAGYDAHEAFTRAFRATFQMSPTQFRKSSKPAHVNNIPCGVHYDPNGVIREFDINESEVVGMNVRIEELRPQRAMFMRHVGPYSEVGKTWGRFMSFLFARGLFRGGGLFALVHDDPEVTPPDKLRYDACVAAPDGFKPEGDVGVQEVPGGPYVVALHGGPYEKLGETYAALFGQWLPAHDREPAGGPCMEVYLNNPQNTPPADLRTEVFVPLASVPAQRVTRD